MDGKKFEASGVEQYRLKFEAEIEFGKDAALGDVNVHQGDHATVAGVITGTKKDGDWGFILSERDIVGASNASLFSSLKRQEDVAKKNACINILRQIDGAKQQWALENKMTTAAVPTAQDIAPYIKLDANGNIPGCPAGGSYMINAVSENPTCSIPGHMLP
jgi:hypothetical protein